MRLLRFHKVFSIVFSKLSKLRSSIPTGPTVMANTLATTHTERTESSFRQENIFNAEVVKINQLSTTVKELKLKVSSRSFGFKPGQWVDFFIPGLSVVGGFSICSSPRDLYRNNTIGLAIKHSSHPPAHWVHTKCIVGDKVQMRVGGNFYLEVPQSQDIKKNILLVAGGVGINPLWSMMKFASENSSSFGHVTLLFSASTKDELLFKDAIIDTCAQHPHLQCSFYISKKSTEDEILDKWTQGGRITKEELKRNSSLFDISNMQAFVCGPQPMIQFVSDSLVDLGVNSQHIHFEQWW